MIPGHTAFTRIPSGPSSCAIAHVNAWIAAFDAEYAAVRAASIFPATDEMLTMLPPSPCSTRRRPNVRLM